MSNILVDFRMLIYFHCDSGRHEDMGHFFKTLSDPLANINEFLEIQCSLTKYYLDEVCYFNLVSGSLTSYYCVFANLELGTRSADIIVT